MPININLLKSKRFAFKNDGGNVIIASEHNATEITVNFPDEYENFSKRVDFLNSKNEGWTEPLYCPEFTEYPTDFNKSVFTFTLPNEVTVIGELRMQFVAYMSDDSLSNVPFEIVPLEIEDGITTYKKSGAKNPDLIILSYNFSSEALFTSQKSQNLSNEAVVKSNEAVTLSGEAKAMAEVSLELGAEAIKKAQTAELAATRVEDLATIVEQKAETAVIKANVSTEVANQAQIISQEAFEKAEQAINTVNLLDEKATEALQLSQNAQNVASIAKEDAETANETAEKANTVALEAIVKADQVIDVIDDIDLKAQYALDNAESAGQKSDEAQEMAQSALTQIVELKEETTKIDGCLTDLTVKIEETEAKVTMANSNAQAALNGLDDKVDNVFGKGLSSEDYTLEEKEKLANVETGATNYTHPALHPPAIIIQDEDNRFVTDAEKDRWNAYKQPHSSSIIIAPFNAMETSRSGADILLSGDETDSEQINAAIGTLASGGEIRILEGVIKCYSTINLSSNITINGQGGGTIFQKQFNGVLFSIIGKENVEIANLKIDGNSSTGYAVLFSEAEYGKLKNVKIFNIADGIDISTCESIFILDSKVSVTAYCTNLTNSSYIKIDNTYLYSATKPAINLGTGVACNKCFIANSTIFSGVNNAIYLRQMHYSKVVNCYIESTGGLLAGSFLQCTYNIILGNTFKSTNNQISLLTGNNNLCLGNMGSVSSTEGNTTLVVNNLS